MGEGGEVVGMMPGACAHLRAETYIHTCIHPYIHACMHTSIHACRHAYIHGYTHTCIHTRMYTCMDTYIHACIHTYIIHADIHTSIHTSVHTFIHTSKAIEMHAACASIFIHVLRVSRTSSVRRGTPLRWKRRRIPRMHC